MHLSNIYCAACRLCVISLLFGGILFIYYVSHLKVQFFSYIDLFLLNVFMPVTFLSFFCDTIYCYFIDSYVNTI